MKRACYVIALLIILASMLIGCNGKGDQKVVIFSSAEEFRNEYLLKRLKEQFPNYEIDLQYISTGNSAAKIKAEGKNTDGDIIYGLEVGYLEQNQDVLADLSSYDTSIYLDEFIPAHKKYLPEERASECIAIREDLLMEKGLQVPQSYEDLLKPEYKGLISMPNPKASSTGYAFLKSLVNAWGEDKALAYFDELTPNILQYTSSGSGPINALVQGEAAIALGMTFQAVMEKNNGVNLSIHFFEPGAPHMLYGTAVIDGRLDNPVVNEVYSFIINTLVMEDKQFSPEKIFKNQMYTMENYPEDIPYCDMSSGDAIGEKTRLLEEWTH